MKDRNEALDKEMAYLFGLEEGKDDSNDILEILRSFRANKVAELSNKRMPRKNKGKKK